MYDSMVPTYPYSVSSHPVPIDLNEDHGHHLFSSNHQASSSSSSLSYSILFNNPDQDQGGSCYWEPKQLQIDDGEARKMVPCGGSWDHSDTEKDENKTDLKLRFRKKEEGCENLQGEDSSMEWNPSKIRMMVSDQRGSNIADISNSKQIKCEEKNPPLSSSLGTDNSNYYNSNHSNITVRVCADCHTTKTPLWRSGPKGPKSLCNACGIRQRKARRAMAVAATVNETNMVSQVKKENKLHNKGMKKSKKVEGASQLKRKCKIGAKYRKRFSTIEDLMMSLSENLALQQVFPQDEKEAAILLMALSYGLLHGFPSHRYFDL